MTYFDPQGVYIRRNKSTKKGQIIQKRPIDLEGAITKYEIPRSLQVLKGSGYHIFPPGSFTARPQVFFLPIYFFTNQSDFRHFTVNTLLSHINQSTELSQFYETNPTSSHVNGIRFIITSLYAQFNTIGPQSQNPSIILYNNDVPVNGFELPIRVTEDDNDNPYITLNGCSGDSLWLSIVRFPLSTATSNQWRGTVYKINLETAISSNGYLSYIFLYDKYDQVRSGHLVTDQHFVEFDIAPTSFTCTGYIYIHLTN